MFGFLFKGATYYILWQKFQVQIITIVISIILIAIINTLYADLYAVLKVHHKGSLLWLLMCKWMLIAGIVIFNIYQLKKVSIPESKDLYQEKKVVSDDLPKKSQVMLEKKQLKSSTDYILERYTEGAQ